MRRADIDKELQDAFDLAGLKQYQIAWQASPSMISALVGSEIKTAPVSTKITRRELNNVKHKIETWGKLQNEHRSRERAA